MNILDSKELRDRLEHKICEGRLCSDCFLNNEETPCLLALLHDSVEEELTKYKIDIGDYVVNNDVLYRLVSDSTLGDTLVNLINVNTGRGLGSTVAHGAVTLGFLSMAYDMEFTIPTHGGEQES